MSIHSTQPKRLTILVSRPPKPLTNQSDDSITASEKGPHPGAIKKPNPEFAPLRIRLGKLQAMQAMFEDGREDVQKPKPIQEKLLLGKGTPSDRSIMNPEQVETPKQANLAKRKAKQARFDRITGIGTKKDRLIISPETTTTEALRKLLKNEDSSFISKPNKAFCKDLLTEIETSGWLKGYSKKMTAAACLKLAGFDLKEDLIDEGAWSTFGIRHDAVKTAVGTLAMHESKLEEMVRVSGGSVRWSASDLAAAMAKTKTKKHSEYEGGRCRAKKWKARMALRQAPALQVACSA